MLGGYKGELRYLFPSFTKYWETGQHTVSAYPFMNKCLRDLLLVFPNLCYRIILHIGNQRDDSVVKSTAALLEDLGLIVTNCMAA